MIGNGRDVIDQVDGAELSTSVEAAELCDKPNNPCYLVLYGIVL